MQWVCLIDWVCGCGCDHTPGHGDAAVVLGGEGADVAVPGLRRALKDQLAIFTALGQPHPGRASKGKVPWQVENLSTSS